MPKRPIDPEARQRWRTFLRNHRDCLAAMDFLTVPTATFRILYVFFIIHHARRRIAHVGVTTNPAADWICQRLREAFPYDQVPRYVIFDRDSKVSSEVVRTLRGMGVKPLQTSYRSPWQNGVAERWVLSARRDLLDHMIVFGERHLSRMLKCYTRYYHEDRCHLALEKDFPTARAVSKQPDSRARVVAPPRVGGLHHRYQCRATA